MGLLDNIFARDMDDPRYAANMAMFAGMMKGDLGGGLLAGSQAAAQSKKDQQEAAYKQLMAQNLQSEMAERTAKIEQARRQQEFSERFMGGGSPGGAPPAAMQGAPSGGMPSGGGMPGAGGMPPGAMPPGGGQPQGQPQQPQGGGFTAQQISKQYGIPMEAVVADFQFNGGKKIAELIDSRSKPNWQNINGNLVNTNAQGFQGGMQAGMSASSDGRVTAWQPDGQGGMTVGAPRGALDTYSAYQRAGEGAKADFDPQTITPPGGRPMMSTRGNVVREINQPQMPPQPGMQGKFVGDPSGVAASIAQIRDPQERANAQAAFEAQMRSSGGRLGIPLQSEPEAAGAKVMAEASARAAAERDASAAKKSIQAVDMLGQIKDASRLLQQGPTHSGIGAAVDAGLGMFGKSTDSGDAAARLDTLSGWMVNNVPRMEGPQSNFDVQNYKSMAGLVGDRTKPISQRLAALETLQGLQSKYAHLNGGAGGASGDFEAPKPAQNLPRPMKGMTRNGYKYMGGDPASPSSWEKQ